MLLIFLTNMASLQGLPPLPKSLSGLLSFSSAQWKEMERIHAMRTMIQQDLNRGRLQNPSGSNNEVESTDGRNLSPQYKIRKTYTLDAQLALLRKEMVDFRFEVWHMQWTSAPVIILSFMFYLFYRLV